MIKVSLSCDCDGLFCSLEASGHAGYDVKGKDIVCAGASSLLQSALLSIEKHIGKKNIICENDFLKWEIPFKASFENRQTAHIIIDTIFLGLKEISRYYPKLLKVSIKNKT